MVNELDTIVEALIFASPEGVSTKEIARCVRSAVATEKETNGDNAAESITKHENTQEEDVVAAISRLNLRYMETERAFMLVERPAGWRIYSRMDYAIWVRELFPDKKPQRLTPSALETLAIIAYRQPITKSSIEAVRGVSVDGPVQTLLDKNIIRIAGRADLPGRPLLYETTDLFLEHFGIKNVEELPNSAELRNVKLPEAAPEAEAPAEQQQELSLPAGAEDGSSDAPSSDAAPASEAKPKKKGRGKKKAAAAEESDAPAPAEDAPPAAAESSEEGESWSASPEDDAPLTVVEEE
jgi:segregation and condensation protein B